jgi:hypothetical protein
MGGRWGLVCRAVALRRAEGKRLKPSHVMPPAVGRRREPAVTASDLPGARRAAAAAPKPDIAELLAPKRELVTVGEAAVSQAALMDFSWPVDRGRVTNWVCCYMPPPAACRLPPAACCLLLAVGAACCRILPPRCPRVCAACLARLCGPARPLRGTWSCCWTQ